MAAAGPGVLAPYSHLYNRPQAPAVFTEGEEPTNQGSKMTIHVGMAKLFA